MTKKLIILALALALPLLAGAATFEASNQIFLNQSVGGNTYLAGSTIYSLSPVKGDLFAAGANIYVSGSTTEDVLLVGGSVSESGPVGGDLRLAGGNLNVRSQVTGDTALAGGQVQILPETVIKGDLDVAGGQVLADGVVHGAAYLVGGEITLNGRFDQDVTVRARKVTIGPAAVITGKLTYYSGEEAVVDPGAQLTGGVAYEYSEPLHREESRAVKGLGLLGIIFSLLMLWVTAWIFSIFLRDKVSNLVTESATHFWSRLGFGLLTLIVLPLLAFLLFVTVIGIPLGIGVFALALLLMIATYAYTAIFAGSWLFKHLGKQANYLVNWRTVIVGALVMSLLTLIPVIGWLVWLVLFLLAVGTLANWFYNRAV